LAIVFLTKKDLWLFTNRIDFFSGSLSSGEGGSLSPGEGGSLSPGEGGSLSPGEGGSL
jgi:hypothetical protein